MLLSGFFPQEKATFPSYNKVRLLWFCSSTQTQMRPCAVSSLLPAASIMMQKAWASVELPGRSKLGAPQAP
jgi:hypothetical protein